ncbi:MAG: sensor histidine kinase [Faecousia sp.]
MRLKNRRLLRGLLCLLISACLAGGCALLQLSQRARENGTIETTATTEWDTTMVTEAEDTSLTTTVTAPLIEETQTEARETEPTSAVYSADRAQKLWIAAAVFLVIGILSALLFVLLKPRRLPLLGPEGELLLLPPAVLWFLQARLLEPLPAAALQFLLTALILYLLHGLWSWVFRRLPLSWCAVYRISVRLSKRSAGAGLLLQSLWTAAAAVCAAVCLGLCAVSLYFAFSCAAFAEITLLSALCLRKSARGIDHLTQQIGRLYEGEKVAVGEGIFAEAETRLNELGKQRDEAIHTAVTSERFKVELISNVSHDLRTPLTAILGYGELLQREALSEQGREQLKRLNQKAGYMRELVESLFELTKVSSGAAASKVEALDLIRLLEQTVGLFDDQLTAAGLTVRRHYAQETLPVQTDGARLHQVFANLLGNAIKYALPGTRIHLQVTETDGHCTVRMTNIASYEMDFSPTEITQRFVRGDKARSTKGSGLGLAIAQTYTESVGGSFHVEIDGDQFAAIVTIPKTAANASLS